jgi:hypothetical protein
MGPSMSEEPVPAASFPDDEEYGDSACWAHRVCPECGRLNEAERPRVCEACSAEFPI